eukprot:c26581_g1_i1.p1 GENE.c26581_g1_i1~~c26581_g1_i1.p1  ORF type:complete len:215 (-),score=30.05 c26581_g1_i1:391-1035(-)
MGNRMLSLRQDDDAFLWPSDYPSPPSAPFALAMPTPPPPSPFRLEMSNSDDQEAWGTYSASSSKRQTDRAWNKWETAWAQLGQDSCFSISGLGSQTNDFPMFTEETYRGLSDDQPMRSVGDDEEDDGNEIDVDRFMGSLGGLRPSHFCKVTVSAQDSSFAFNKHDECSVCLEAISQGENVASLRCGHGFHSLCLRDWFKTSHQCPNCRFDVEDN